MNHNGGLLLIFSCLLSYETAGNVKQGNIIIISKGLSLLYLCPSLYFYLLFNDQKGALFLYFASKW